MAQVVLKGIIRYSDYSFAIVIFECFKSNGIFVFFLKPHITHFSSLLVLHNGHLTKDFGFWLILKIRMLHFLSAFSNYFANNVFCNQLFSILTHGIEQQINRYVFVDFGDQIFE